jgi:drug/metabolite transporter (DMT)-like permease
VEVTRRSWHPYAALAALGLLLGPIRTYIVPPAVGAFARHELGAEAIASCVAGLVVLAFSREGQPNAGEPRSRAIWLLLLPQFLATLVHTHVLPFLPHRELEWGTTAALTMASPLWLFLLVAVQLVSAEVPRVTAAAAIAGISTVLLSLETSAYSVETKDLPALIGSLALALLTVYIWAYAAPRLCGEVAARWAALFLLLRAAMDALFSAALERTSLGEVVWRDALELLALYAALTAVSMFLWFWLLKHLPLSAFALHPLAVWTASILGGMVVFGLANWRIDLAAAVDLAALWFGLRARFDDEQPVSLQLG